MIRGIAFKNPELASRVSRAAFERGLIVETAGPRDEVLKLMPALTIDDASLEEGLSVVHAAAIEVCESSPPVELADRCDSEAAE